MGKPITDPLEAAPAERLMARPLYAHESSLNTYRIMNDPEDLSMRWFDPAAGTIEVGNEVKYLVNGSEAFPEMAAAMKTAVGPGHFIYLLGWWLDLDLPMSGAETPSTIFTAAAAAGVQVRAMLWRNITGAANPRRVWVMNMPLTAVIRIDVKEIVPGGPPPTPDVRLGEVIVSTFDVPGEAAPALFDGSPDPWWAPGLQGGPVPNVQNTAGVDFINALACPVGAGHCAAILDSRHPIAGAHHQKVLIVLGKDGLIGFCGGIDLNKDRLSFLYDVHCRVDGPGAHALLRVFNERWRDHPDQTKVEQGKPHLGIATPKPSGPGGKRARVQVARTYFNPNRPVPPMPSVPTMLADPGAPEVLAALARNMDPFPGYSFARTGATECWRMLKHAIATARKFIYMENQYFVSEELARELASAVPRLAHLTLLIELASDVDRDHGAFRTKRCLQILRNADPQGQRVRVFCRRKDIPLQFAHSKTYIFDDELAVIGSANANRRGLTFDSEVALAIHDPAQDDEAGWRFAHRLRVKLWAGHLGMDTEEGHANLADGVASVAHWHSLPPGSSVIDYVTAVNALSLSAPAPDWEWDLVRDPVPGPI